MNASYPYFNPNYKHPLKNKDKVCRAVEHERIGNKVSAKFEENGANVTNGQIAYTLNGGEVRRMVHIKWVKGINLLVFFLKERPIMFLILWMKIIFWFLTQKCPTC